MAILRCRSVCWQHRHPYSSPKFSPPLPEGTLPKSPEGRARETLREWKAVVRYVDGQGWKHASSRDELLIPAVTRFAVDLRAGTMRFGSVTNHSDEDGPPRYVQ